MARCVGGFDCVAHWQMSSTGETADGGSLLRPGVDDLPQVPFFCPHVHLFATRKFSATVVTVTGV